MNTTVETTVAGIDFFKSFAHTADFVTGASRDLFGLSIFNVGQSAELVGQFSGSGRFSIRLQLHRSSSSVNVTFEVDVFPKIVEGATTVFLARSVPYTSPLRTLHGGFGDLTTSLSGSLPTGMALEPSGQISGTPSEVGTFNATFSVIDELGAKLDLGTTIYHVLPGITIEWDRSNTTTDVIFDEPFTLPPPNFKLSDDAGEVIFFPKGDLPPGLSINPTNGAIFGKPSRFRQEPYMFELWVRETFGSSVLVERMSLLSRRRNDCEVDEHGPNGKACASGICIDDVPFDQSFACDCTDPTFIGENCEIQASKESNNSTTSLLPYLAGGFGALFVLGLAAFIYVRRRPAQKPFDFEAVLDVRASGSLCRLMSTQEMQSSGSIRTKTVPREIKRQCIVQLDKLGNGQFGEVFKGTVDESASTGVPECKSDNTLSFRDIVYPPLSVY